MEWSFDVRDLGRSAPLFSREIRLDQGVKDPEQVQKRDEMPEMEWNYSVVS
jgi:hypothetical protein